VHGIQARGKRRFRVATTDAIPIYLLHGHLMPTKIILAVNGLIIEWTAFGIAGNGESAAAIYASELISDQLQLRLSNFLDR
jgi:hypothetical protein